MKEINDKTYCVYIHTSPSNKRYVGITSQRPPEQRWANGHGYNHNSHFTNAINFYGWDNFNHEIVADGLTSDDAMMMEQTLIEKYNTMDQRYGYNQTSGGEVNKQYTEEVKNKIRKAAIRNTQMPYRRKQLSEQAKKLWADKEFVARKSKMLQEQWKDPKFKAAVASKRKLQNGEKNPFYGKHHTEETKKKISEKNSNRKITEETRKKLSLARIKTWQNEEYRVKMIKNLSGENNPNYGKRHTDNVKDIIGEKNGIPVVQLDKYDNFVAEFRSAKMAEAVTKINRTTIYKCCKKKQKTSGGYKWMYKEDYDKIIHNKTMDGGEQHCSIK